MSESGEGGLAGSGLEPALVHVGRGAAAPRGDTSLVVGFDRSAASRAALTKAAEIAERLGADLHVLHCVELSDYPVDPDAVDWEAQAEKSLEGDRQVVSDLLAGYSGSWSYVVVRAEPARALNWAGEHFDALMIVVGVRSTGWRHLLERLAGPTVSHRLVGHTHRPVLLVSSPTGH